MATQHKEGFTIIETMLVLAISGALIMSLLVGVGTSINVQRYRDSVMSLKSLIQDQYSEIENVRNGRVGNWSCSTTVNPVQGGAGALAPGQTDCMLLGRYISIVDDMVTTATVIGYEKSTTPGATEVATLKNNYVFGISASSVEKSALEWGAKIAWPKRGEESGAPTNPRGIAILILRSPDSGSMYTFTANTVNPIDSVSATTIRDMIVAGQTIPGQKGRALCIEPNGVGVPELLAVYVAANGNGPSSVETRSDNLFQTLGSDTRCKA